MSADPRAGRESWLPGPPEGLFYYHAAVVETTIARVIIRMPEPSFRKALAALLPIDRRSE